MDSTIIRPYIESLEAHKARLEDYLTRGFHGISIPAGKEDISAAGKDFLTVSGQWFIAIGFIALAVGLIMGNAGVAIAGFAAALSGGYCIFKGRQALRRSAYAAIGRSLYAQITDVADNIAGEWSKFVVSQNSVLKAAIVSSDAAAEAKVSLIDKIDSTPMINVDLSGVKDCIETISTNENASLYAACLPQAAEIIRKAIDVAEGARRGIYSTLAKIDFRS